MIIETERLILRGVGDKESDLNDLVEGCNNLNVSQWMLVLPFPYTKKDAKSWIKECQKNYKNKKKECYDFAIELKSEKKLIGGIGLGKVKDDQKTATIGYWLNEKYHRQRYGSEALKAVLKFAFNDLKLRRIDASVYPGNPSSGKILEKFGAKQEGIKRESKICKADGKIKDEVIYGILKEEAKLD